MYIFYVYIVWYVLFVWRYIKRPIRFLFTQWEVNDDLHPPDPLLFSLRVNRNIVTFVLIFKLKTTRKITQVCLTKTGKMASIGNSITDDTGSDAVPGGGSIIKLEVTPGNQFYLKYSIFTIAKINAPKIIWFFWNGKHSVIHKSGQALAMDASLEQPGCRPPAAKALRDGWPWWKYTISPWHGLLTGKKTKTK